MAMEDLPLASNRNNAGRIIAHVDSTTISATESVGVGQVVPITSLPVVASSSTDSTGSRVSDEPLVLGTGVVNASSEVADASSPSILSPNLEVNDEKVVDLAMNKQPDQGIAMVKLGSDCDVVTEPPTKRQRIDEVLPEADKSTLSNVDAATVTIVGKTTSPQLPSSDPIKSIPFTNNNHSPSLISTTQLLLPDYTAVRQTVHDLLALLQLYGPLTANQLEYNLPPVVPTSIPWNVHEVLSILVAIGLVQNVKGTTDQYCIFGGIPRATVIFPTEIPSEIQRALNEADESYKRCQILRDALRPTQTTPVTNNQNISHRNPRNYKDVLKQLLQEYPHITNDPVYWTALRSCLIDMGNGSTNLHFSEKRSNTSSKASTKGSNKGTASAHIREGSKFNKPPKIANEKSGSVIATNEKKSLVTAPLLTIPPIGSTAITRTEQLNTTSTNILASATTEQLNTTSTNALVSTTSATSQDSVREISTKVLEVVEQSTMSTQLQLQGEIAVATISSSNIVPQQTVTDGSKVGVVKLAGVT